MPGAQARRKALVGLVGLVGLVALVVVALAMAGCGGGSTATRSSATGARTPAASAATPPAGAPVAPAGAPAPPRRPQIPKPLLKLRKALTRALRKAGPEASIAVYDLTSHAFLFTQRDRVRRAPASVEKLYTTLAVLNRLGPNATLPTSVVATGHLGPAGVWHGDLYLKGNGDPTFGDGAFNRTWELGYGPTATELTQQLLAARIRRVKGHVIGDESLFDTRRGGPSTGFAPDLPDFGGELSALTYDHGSTLGGARSPAAFAAKQLVQTLKAEHVKAKASPRTGTPPSGASTLASVTSPPMSVLLRLMDVPSDDLFAEMLTKQLGARFAREGSIAAGARVIAHTIGRVYHLYPRIRDGSGLSRDDSSSPLEVVDLLRRVWRTSAGAHLVASLPTVGVSGTVRTIANGTAAQGRCLAKTGTLTDVTNLAGFCHARGHRGLAFALFLDGPPNWQALTLEGQMLAAIASY